MIRIAFIIDTIEKPTAGTEQQLLLLLKHLDRSKFEPFLCVLRTSKWLEEEFDLCPLYQIDIKSFKTPSSLWSFYRFVCFLRTQKISITYSFFRDGIMVGVPAGKLAKVNLNISSRRNQGYWMTPFDLKITKFLNRWVDIIIANSYNTKEFVQRTEGFPKEKIHVIYNGIDSVKFQNIPATSRLENRLAAGIPLDAYVVGIVANLRPVKSIDVFLRAAQLVIKKIPETYFVIVGDGDQKEELEELVQELSIGDKVRFLGRQEDIPSVLTMFDIGALSSSSESFSNAILEYLAVGLPVVCTDVGGISEIVETNVNGFIVPINDYTMLARKILKIIQNDKLLEMGKASHKIVENYIQLNRMINQYENIF